MFMYLKIWAKTALILFQKQGFKKQSPALFVFYTVLIIISNYFCVIALYKMKLINYHREESNTIMWKSAWPAK